MDVPTLNVLLSPSQPYSISPSQQPCDKPTSRESFNSSYSREQDGLFSSNQDKLSSAHNATENETNPMAQHLNLETIGPSPSQEPTAEPTSSNMQQNEAVQ
eukprot:13530174-Ditylum_brightwellii.AAC.1